MYDFNLYVAFTGWDDKTENVKINYFEHGLYQNVFCYCCSAALVID